MCGILGGDRPDWDYEQAAAAMRHRGPDAQEIVRMEGFVLGFMRLAIIDLSQDAMQPMFTCDKRVGMVFNGEIYGYKKLRARLEGMGYRFRSQSDTEAALYAYMEWGDRFVHHIDGMFAIAIYDKRAGEIHLFRDHAGIKPIYYYYDGRCFGFASELKGICAMCGSSALQIDTTALYDYLIYQYIPDPKSLYRNVRKLEPAHKLVYDIKSKKIREISRYWSLPVNTQKSGKADALQARQRLRELISQSVREQLVADVPVGSFLSGGVDSSVVTYEAGRRSRDFTSFTLGFPEKAYDESPFASLAAEAFGIPLRRLEMDRDAFSALYPLLRQWYDEPFGDSSAFSNYMISKHIREHVKVALTGDGGDEVFGGYKRYQIFSDKAKGSFNNKLLSDMYKRSGWDRYLPYRINRAFYDDVEEYAYVSGFIGEPRIRANDKQVRRTLGIPDDYDVYWHFRKYYHRDLPRITMAQYIDFHCYLPCAMLTKVDRTSMAVSLEARVPLLDRRVVEYAFSLPQDSRCTPGELKKILKDAYRQRVPDAILFRPKKGFTTPEGYYKRLGFSFRERVLRDLWKIRVT